MWNPFEQPWTLLATAGVAFLVIMTYRAICPDKQRPWQFAIPIVIVILAFGLDFAVATDSEKVHALVADMEQAGRAQDMAALERLLAEDYRDSYHQNKRSLIEHARSALAKSPIKGIKQVGLNLEQLNPPSASVGLSVVALFTENSLVATTYKSSLFVSLQLSCAKQPDSRWLIKSIELLEVDKQPISWGRTTGL
jgi:hypothetical protein